MTNNIARFLRRHAATILTCLGAAGTVATGVMSAKAAPKANLMLKNTEEEKKEKLTKAECFFVAAPAYIPAAVVGVSTIVCIFGANVLNLRTQASLASAYALVSSAYKDYRNKVIELHGEEMDREISLAIAQDKDDAWTDQPLTWFIEGQPGFFERTKEEVADAECKFLRNYRLRYEEACLNDLYEMLGLPKTEEGDRVGWTASSMGGQWLDIYHEKRILDDGMEVIEITMPVWAHENYLADPDGCW